MRRPTAGDSPLARSPEQKAPVLTPVLRFTIRTSLHFQPERHRPVVDQPHLHVGAEATGSGCSSNSELKPRGGGAALNDPKRWARVGIYGWFDVLFVLSTLLPCAAMILTSLGLSVGTATIVVIVGALIACATVFGRGWLKNVVEDLATLARVVPKIVIAVSLVLAWNALWIWIAIYNTIWMLLANVVICITDALNYSSASLRSLNRELVASLLLLPAAVDTTATIIFDQFEQGDVSRAMATVTIGVSHATDT